VRPSKTIKPVKPKDVGYHWAQTTQPHGGKLLGDCKVSVDTGNRMIRQANGSFMVFQAN
jgi:hypothetical protein